MNPKLTVDRLRWRAVVYVRHRQSSHTHVSLKEAAQYLQVCEGTVRHMIMEKKLPAAQVVECAPWEIAVEAIDSEEVRKIITKIKNRSTRPQKPTAEERRTMLSVI